MRNTTKLKHLLLRYTLSFELEDETVFKLTLIDKFNHTSMVQFEGSTYASVLDKAYRYFNKVLNSTETE